MNGLPTNVSPAGKDSDSPPGPAIALHRILVPIDFSPASERGLAFAGALAERFHAQIDLLYVVEPPALPVWGYAHIPQREAKLRRAAEARLPQLPEKCGINPGLIRSIDVHRGEAGDEVCRSAAEGPADLIVLASHGLGRLRHALMGSTAEHVVRSAPCPVLTVRDRVLRKKGPGTSLFDLKRIVVTTDFSEESKKAFPYAVALARKFEATLSLLHVTPASAPVEFGRLGIVLEEKRLREEARERLRRFRQTELDPRLQVETLALAGRPAHEICGLAEMQEAGLIVMATHGRTGLKHFLLGSVAENVARHAPCPVLVVREQEREFVKG